MIQYSIIYSRRKSISIIINRDKTVTIRAPYFTSKSSIARFVASKREWIIKHVSRQDERTTINAINDYSNDGKIYFLGKPYTLSIEQISTNKNSVEITGDTIIISSKRIEQESIAKITNKWYSRQASTFFAAKIEEIIAQYRQFNFKPTELHVKPMKSRWGSCSRSGKITLNTHLMKIDEKYSTYVIKHELCHLKEMNHGAGFYKILEQLAPDYKTIRKEMRNFRLQ